MDADLASLFRCPAGGGPLALVERPAPAFVGVDSGITYPIERGIPRFAGDGYVASFGRQWNRYDVARDEEDEATFAVKTGVPAAELAGKFVLDAGCGGGRYTRLVAKHGAKVVGVDLSAAVEKAQSLCSGLPGVAIAQADLGRLPLAEGVFDFAFSIGVLHHGPDPRGAFAEVAKRVRQGGRFAVWLYRKNTRPQEWANGALRSVTSRLPARVLEPACAALGLLGGVPILNRTLNKVANLLESPRLDSPRLRQLRLVRPRIPVTSHRR